MKTTAKELKAIVRNTLNDREMRAQSKKMAAHIMNAFGDIDFGDIMRAGRAIDTAIKFAKDHGETTVDGYELSELYYVRNMMAIYVKAVQATIKEA